jgi:hypothetical protein
MHVGGEYKIIWISGKFAGTIDKIKIMSYLKKPDDSILIKRNGKLLQISRKRFIKEIRVVPDVQLMGGL